MGRGGGGGGKSGSGGSGKSGGSRTSSSRAAATGLTGDGKPDGRTTLGRAMLQRGQTEGYSPFESGGRNAASRSPALPSNTNSFMGPGFENTSNFMGAGFNSSSNAMGGNISYSGYALPGPSYDSWDMS